MIKKNLHLGQNFPQDCLPVHKSVLCTSFCMSDTYKIKAQAEQSNNNLCIQITGCAMNPFPADDITDACQIPASW